MAVDAKRTENESSVSMIDNAEAQPPVDTTANTGVRNVLPISPATFIASNAITRESLKEPLKSTTSSRITVTGS